MSEVIVSAKYQDSVKPVDVLSAGVLRVMSSSACAASSYSWRLSMGLTVGSGEVLRKAINRDSHIEGQRTPEKNFLYSPVLLSGMSIDYNNNTPAWLALHNSNMISLYEQKLSHYQLSPLVSSPVGSPLHIRLIDWRLAYIHHALPMIHVSYSLIVRLRRMSLLKILLVWWVGLQPEDRIMCPLRK